MWISVHGPHGPVSPISQKLSFLLPRWMCDGSMSVTSFQSSHRFLVGLQAIRRVALENRRVQAILVDAPDLRQQLPRPADRFLLEVIAERPVAEHLEEGVVIGVLADVVEIVVLAAGADALLRIAPRRLYGRLPVPRKTSLNWFMPALVNSSVGSSSGTTGDDGTMACSLLSEEVDELLADLVGGPDVGIPISTVGYQIQNSQDSSCSVSGGWPGVASENSNPGDSRFASFQARQL